MLGYVELSDEDIEVVGDGELYSFREVESWVDELSCRPGVPQPVYDDATTCLWSQQRRQRVGPRHGRRIRHPRVMLPRVR